MADFVTLADAVIAVVPAAALFFAAYGRYDGMFRDNVVFLHFIGGLLVGGLLGVVSLFAFSAVDAPLITVVIVALFYPITLVLGINRRKWQGERHAVFNGGALGLGAAVMVSLSILYKQTLTLRALAPGVLGITALPDGTFRPEDADAIRAYVNAQFWTAPNLAQDLLLAAAFAGVLFGLGLLAGDGVRRRKAIPTALLGTAIVLPVAVFLEEYVQGRVWLWVGLMLAYGAVFAILAERRLFIEGISEDDRKALRRRKRAAQE